MGYGGVSNTMTRYVSATALGAHLGCSRVTIHEYVARKVFARGTDGLFDEDDCRLKAFAYLRDKAGGRSGGGDKNLAEVRAELTREQTQAVAMKNAITRGDYVPLAIVKRNLESVLTTVRERILSIPGKSALACEMRSRGEIEEIMRAELHEALDELSRPIIPISSATVMNGD
jgi:phage terminase Nu1 subunit (DNA packaging protein)